MPAHRLERINELIKQEFGKILLKEGDFEPGILVTVMAVETSEDLRHANVSLSIFPDKIAQKTMEGLNRRIFFLQQSLNKKLKMHPVPQIRFSLTRAESESEKIERLIEKTK